MFTDQVTEGLKYLGEGLLLSALLTGAAHAQFRFPRSNWAQRSAATPGGMHNGSGYETVSYNGHKFSVMLINGDVRSVSELNSQGQPINRVVVMNGRYFGQSPDEVALAKSVVESFNHPAAAGTSTAAAPAGNTNAALPPSGDVQPHDGAQPASADSGQITPTDGGVNVSLASGYRVAFSGKDGTHVNVTPANSVNNASVEFVYLSPKEAAALGVMHMNQRNTSAFSPLGQWAMVGGRGRGDTILSDSMFASLPPSVHDALRAIQQAEGLLSQDAKFSAIGEKGKKELDILVGAQK